MVRWNRVLCLSDWSLLSTRFLSFLRLETDCPCLFSHSKINKTGEVEVLWGKKHFKSFMTLIGFYFVDGSLIDT